MSQELGPRGHLEALLAVVGPVAGLSIIDIGCGEGALARELAALGAEVTGVDPLVPARDWEAVETGRFRILATGAESLPLPDTAFDLALFVFSLHHLPGAVLAEGLREARRVLRPAGRLYVAEPLVEGDYNSLTSLFHDESEVRAQAQAALDSAGRAMFGERSGFHYVHRHRFQDYEAFAARATRNMRFNGYTAEDVRRPAVRAHFAEIAARTGGLFEQPVRVDLLG